MPGDRVIDLSQSPARVSMRNDCLVVEREGEAPASVALVDIACVVLSHRQITMSKGALDAVARAGAALIVCGDDFLPSGLMLPLVANFEQSKRVVAQARAKRPLGKRMWQQMVVAKIAAQASNLESLRGDGFGLRALAASVRSGDPENVEAQAAQRYWKALFDDPDFVRRREAENQNKLLNYGYAVVRAAVGRALCAAGLHPSLGVHHHGRNNPFCLADDVMEPYRALVDHEVARSVGEWGSDAPLDGKSKSRLVGVLHERLTSKGEDRTVLDWIGRTAWSVAESFLTGAAAVEYPAGLTERADGSDEP